MRTNAVAKPRLLIVVNNAAFFLSHRAPIAKAGRDAGFDIHVATPYGPSVSMVQELGFEWHEIALRRSSRLLWTEFSTIKSLVRLYHRLRPTIVHHVTPKPVLYGTLAARIARTPAVVNAISGMGHVFADETAGTRLVRCAAAASYRLILHHPRMYVIFQNTDVRADFLSRRWVRKEQAALIRGSGVDVDAFFVERRPERIPVVSMVSRMLWTKGVREFVDAASQLRAAGVAARFVLVGAPDLDNPSSVPEANLREWDAKGLIEWWGHRSDMPQVLRESDVACLPSYLEGLPKSLLEAAAASLPIVATNVPGCREVVREGENGFLVTPRDAKSVASALEALIVSRTLRERFGAVGRQRAEREFTVDAVCRAHIELYQNLLS
jgi:glycosyltransferase involved in cell wall biosynthesis